MRRAQPDSYAAFLRLRYCFFGWFLDFLLLNFLSVDWKVLSVCDFILDRKHYFAHCHRIPGGLWLAGQEDARPHTDGGLDRISGSACMHTDFSAGHKDRGADCSLLRGAVRGAVVVLSIIHSVRKGHGQKHMFRMLQVNSIFGNIIFRDSFG